MSEQISRETFDHLVELAALELDETQAEYLRRELNAQLNAIAELSAIPIPADTPISLHGVDFPLERSAQPREDQWMPFDDPDSILAQAPQTEGRYIVVPDIPHTRISGKGEDAE